MPWRVNNPYPKHTLNHFFWNVYHLLAYQFSRYAVAAWIMLVIAISWSLHKISVQQDHSKKVDKVLAIQGNRTAKLVDQNRQLLMEIQKGRVRSCKTTYDTVRSVFRELYPPPETRTPAQREAIDRLENFITSKRNNCAKQTGVKK